MAHNLSFSFFFSFSLFSSLFLYFALPLSLSVYLSFLFFLSLCLSFFISFSIFNFCTIINHSYHIYFFISIFLYLYPFFANIDEPLSFWYMPISVFNSVVIQLILEFKHTSVKYHSVIPEYP